MIPKKIAFTKKYFPEQYHGEDYYIEYILEEGDTLQDAFKKAKEETLQCFKNNNPQIQWYPEVIQVNDGINKISNDQFTNIINHADTANAKTRPYENTTEKIQKGTIEEQIEACTEIEKPNGLESFEIFAKSNSKVKAVYDKKMDELKQKKVSELKAAQLKAKQSLKTT